MVARRHHYVPRCYLKGFSVPRKGKPQVHVFDKVLRKAFATAIDNVALERDFNTVKVDGLEPDAFEKAMASFEGELASSLERIIAAQSLENMDDRATLLNFITFLALRNPRQREMMRDFHERVAKRIMNVALATPERWAHQVKKATEAGYLKPNITITYEEMKKFVADGEYDVFVPTERHIQLEVGTFEKLLALIFRRGWILLKVPGDSGGFITSDHPVCLMTVGPRSPGVFTRPGYGLRNTEVLFPISSRLGLVGSFETEDDVAEINDQMLSDFNGAVAAHAERQVYSRDHQFKYSFKEGTQPRKASKLIDDRDFRAREEDDNDEDE
jgi:hypothetical protein